MGRDEGAFIRRACLRERGLYKLPSDFKWMFIGKRRLKEGGLLLEDLP